MLQLPRPDRSELDELDFAATAYSDNPRSVEDPPWVFARRWQPRSDRAIVAAITAVDMVAPDRSTEPQPWLVRAVLRAAGGSLVISAVAIEHRSDPAIELTSVALNGIRLGRIRDRALASLEWKPVVLAAVQSTGDTVSQAEMRWAEEAAERAANRPLRLGRVGYPADHYRRVALAALELHRAGHRDVVRALADREGRPYETVRGWIKRARSSEYGFLAPAPGKGRQRWVPGPQLFTKESGNG